MAGSDLEVARRVLADHGAEVFARSGVVGMGIGEAERGPGFAIVVYVRTPEDVPGEPQEVEGVPLRFEVTGPQRAL